MDQTEFEQRMIKWLRTQQKWHDRQANQLKSVKELDLAFAAHRGAELMCQRAISAIESEELDPEWDESR